MVAVTWMARVAGGTVGWRTPARAGDGRVDGVGHRAVQQPRRQVGPGKAGPRRWEAEQVRQHGELRPRHEPRCVGQHPLGRAQVELPREVRDELADR